MDKVKNLIKGIKKYVCTVEIALDVLFLVGVIILLATNFVVNVVFGLYSVALFLIALSIYLANTQSNKKGR